MLLTRTLLVLFVFAAGAQAVSAAEAWRIVASTGVVKTGAPGVMPVAVNTKQALPVDSWVETGASGRIVLSRGVESIAVGPNSRVMLPALTVNGNTQVLQTVGTALYQIGKQKAPHFQVDTPYLAAVVKGTTFTVSVTEGAASVDVSEGLVAVATPDGADSADVRPGFTAFVQRGQGDKVVVMPTRDGSVPGAAPRDGNKSKLDGARSHKETRVVIPAAIGELALDVKSVSGGLATGTDTSPKAGMTKVASAVAGAISNAADASESKSSGLSSVGVSTDAASVNIDAGGTAGVDVSAGSGAASVDVAAGGGGVSVDVGAGGAGASVDVGVGGGNGNGNGLGVGVGVGAGGGGASVGVGVGNGGVGIGLGLGAGGGGGGLGLNLGLGGRGS